MLQDIKKLDDIYELLKGNICDDPENYPGYILVKNDYDVCFRIFIYRELLQSTLTFYIDNSENPDNLIIYLRDLNNHYENNYKEFVLDYNSDNNTYYDENNVYNIYDSTKNILDEIIRHYKIIKKDVPVESTRIEIGVSDVRYMIEHILSQDYSKYGDDNKYTDDGIQASNKYKDENLNLSTYSSISDFQNYINSKNDTATQRFVNDLENITLDEEFKQIIDEIFSNYNIDKELYIRFSPHDEIEGVRETQVKLAIEKDGKIPQYEDDTEYYDSIVSKEKTPLFNRNLIYQNNKIDYIENKLFNYFAFNITTGGTINFTGTSSNVLYYSKNNGTTWIEASGNIPVSAGDKILWKGVTTPGAISPNQGIGTFGGDADVRYSVEGNIMSLLFGDDFEGQISLEGKDYALYRLFNNNKNITSAENLSLPATTLTSDCYNYMFYGCTNLTTAPSVLPATILAERCYMSMFNDCTGLITVPELPATTLKFSCYSNMFGGCTNLTTAPELPATTLAPNCYYHMFKKCTSLTIAPELLATTLAQNCYREMFQGCTSLTIAPELPAMTLTSDCYYGMFNGCTNLVTAPELPATMLATNCYQGMFYNCTSLTTAPELPATTLVGGCYTNMFKDCTSLTTAPDLLATTLVERCYYQMFYGCTSLNSIKCLATDISATGCTTNWVRGVPPYEAEIEYLESTGTQYIDTGVLMNTLTDEMRLEYLITNKNNFCGVAGARLGASSRSVTVAYNGNISSIDCNNSNYTISRAEILDNQINIRYTAISSITRRGLYQGATVLATNNNYSDVFTSNSIYVFAVNGINNKASIRLYNFTIKSNTTKIDLIPVRIGQVGYMYDKVSGQLFGNAGTGNFVLGNDVKVNTFIKDSSMEDWTTGNNGIPNGWAIQNV